MPSVSAKERKTMPDKFHNIIVYRDCECGKKFFVFDRDRSETVLKPWERRELKRTAKKVGRQFIESGRLFTCPACSESTDLSKSDEKYEIKDGGELTRVA
jgi:hypothetical protein